MEGAVTDGLDLLEEWLELIQPIDESEEAVRHRDFADEVRERMLSGRRTYGDKSFGLPFSMLMAEAQQEAVDLAGWPYMAWRQLRRRLDALPNGDAMRLPIVDAMAALENIGWQASLNWTRMCELVDEVAEIDRKNNDHEQDGN